MASDGVKYAPINGGGGTAPRFTSSDIKSLFCVGKTRKTTTFAYAFVFTFVAVTVFLAFSPSPNSASPWFSNIFTSGGGGGDSSAADSYRFSTIFSHFFPNSSSPTSRSADNMDSQSPSLNLTDPVAKNESSRSPGSDFADPVAKNGTSRSPGSDFADPVAKNGTFRSPGSDFADPVAKNGTFRSPGSDFADPVAKNGTFRSPGSDFADPVAKNGTFRSPNSEFADPIPNNATSRSPVADAQNATVPSTSSNETTLVPGTATTQANVTDKGPISSKNQSQTPVSSDLDKSNNQTQTDANSGKNQSSNPNQPTSSTPKPTTDPVVTEDWIESLKNCDFFDGNWVMDDSYPLYKPDSCKLIDEQFNCIHNGRPDKDFQKLKWKPKKCNLPRLNGTHMLEMIRGRRLVFVGDSLNRNMWESLVCILRGAVKDQRNVYEASGRHHFRGEAEYSFVFKDYNCTVEFFVSPFLVQEWENTDKNGTKKETLRLDLVGKSSEQYKGADIIVFNTGHWWTHEKTSKGADYYQEGSHIYGELNVLEAFRKALTTWARWVDKNVNPAKSLVFFRGYSASHFSGGQWNSGGACDSETQPIRNETYLTPYPPKMQVLEKVIKNMKTPVTYLNITRLTDYRKDGHPSIYRKLNLPEAERRSPLRFQDCSHWCLPGVPDSWNEILYTELIVKLNRIY